MSDSNRLQILEDERKKNKIREVYIKKVLNKKMSVKAASKRFRISPNIFQEWLNDEERKQNDEKRKLVVFSKDDSIKLREHIKKCANTQAGITTVQIRRMVYEYASKLPNCLYPKAWDKTKMATVVWLRYFLAEHPELRKTLHKKHRNSCICIMGCHMGPEGKEAFEELEVKYIITRVYHYLQREYQYMQTYNDLSLLMNILRRTAEATGVCEQTITSILEEEKKTIDSIHEDLPPKQCPADVVSVLEDHNYMNGNVRTQMDALKETNNVNTNVIYTDFESSSKADTVVESNGDTVNNTHSSDIERLQQDCPSIKSVKVEILEDDSDESGPEFVSGDRNNDSQRNAFSLLRPRDDWMDDDEDDGALVIASEPSKSEEVCDNVEEEMQVLDTNDDVMVIETDPLELPNKCDDVVIKTEIEIGEPVTLVTQKDNVVGVKKLHAVSAGTVSSSQLSKISVTSGNASPKLPTSGQTIVLCIGSTLDKNKKNKDADKQLKSRHMLPAQINEVIRSFRTQDAQSTIRYNLVKKPPPKKHQRL